MSQNKRNAIFLLLIILGAAAVRFYGLGWGLPYHFHSDEYVMAYFTEKLRTTESVSRLIAQELRFFLYPPVLMYLNIGLVSVASLFHSFSPADPASIKLFYLLGRGLVAFFGVGTVGLLYFLGRRLYSRRVGLLAALFLAFTVLHVRDSHFFCTDVPVTFFLVLIVYLSSDIVQINNPRSYILTGLTAGIGMATKQTAIMALPVIAAAHWIGTRGKKDSAPRVGWRTLGSAPSIKRLALILGVIAVSFFIADPFVLINPARFLEMSRKTAEFVKGADQPQWTFQFTGSSVGYWFSNLLYFGMGPFLEALGLLGVLWAFFKRKWADVLVLLFLLTYSIGVLSGYMKFIRYAVPLLPFLTLLGARLGIEIYDNLRNRYLRLGQGFLLAAAAAASIFYSLAYLNVYRREDVRIQASRWIHDHIPARSTVLIDTSNAGPLLGTMFFHPQFYDNYIIGLGRDYFVKDDYYQIKVLNLITYASQSLRPPEKFKKYLKERLENVEYIFMSDEHYEQYSRRSQDYPGVVQFYRRLFSGRMGFQLIQTFKIHPSLFGLTINDDRSELTFRLFDHPKVMIFKKINPTS